MPTRRTLFLFSITTTAMAFLTVPSITFLKTQTTFCGWLPGMVLNMYDGNIFHVFNYNKDNDYKSIGSNVIQGITKDKRGNIWITTIEGISRYEKFTGKFHNYFYNQSPQGHVSEQEYALALDTAGRVYCFNQKTGLSYYDADSIVFGWPASRGSALGVKFALMKSTGYGY